MPAILLIRPENRLAADMETCRAAGWTGIPCPPFVIEPVAEALAALPLQSAAADVLCWVSPGAVETGASVFKTAGITAKPHAAVGRATAAVLKAAGCRRIVCPEEGNDSEALLRHPFWHTLPAGSRILLIRGTTGREHLTESWRAAGFSVQTAGIYRRIPTAVDTQCFKTAGLCAAWVTSGESVRHFFNHLPFELVQTAQSLLYFAHHPRIADELTRFGVRRICLTDTLNRDILLHHREPDNER